MTRAVSGELDRETTTSLVLFRDRNSVFGLIRRVDVGFAGQSRQLDDQDLVEGDAFDPFQELVVQASKVVALDGDVLFGEEILEDLLRITVSSVTP